MVFVLTLNTIPSYQEKCSFSIRKSSEISTNQVRIAFESDKPFAAFRTCERKGGRRKAILGLEKSVFGHRPVCQNERFGSPVPTSPPGYEGPCWKKQILVGFMEEKNSGSAPCTTLERLSSDKTSIFTYQI